MSSKLMVELSPNFLSLKFIVETHTELSEKDV